MNAFSVLEHWRWCKTFWTWCWEVIRGSTTVSQKIPEGACFYLKALKFKENKYFRDRPLSFFEALHKCLIFISLISRTEKNQNRWHRKIVKPWFTTDSREVLIFHDLIWHFKVWMCILYSHWSFSFSRNFLDNNMIS